MKKILIVLVAAMFAFTGFFMPPVTAQAAIKTDYIISQEDMTAQLKEFIGTDDTNIRADRTSFKEGEKRAAEWLHTKLEAFEGVSVEMREFEVQTDYNSQNIVAKINGAASGEEAKRVIIGTYYDNLYSKTANISGTESHGALLNATGVSVALKLAEYFGASAGTLPFDIEIVFFGGGAVGQFGSVKYVLDEGGIRLQRDTLLMINLLRLGCDNTYVYTDEAPRSHSGFIFDKAEQNGLTFKNTSKFIPNFESKYMEILPYTNWAMVGDHSPFMEYGINVANIFGGNLDTLKLGNIESGKSNKGISNTSHDTFIGLESTYPEYARKMAEAATLVVKTLEDGEFSAAMTASYETRVDYSFMSKTWVASVIVIGIIILLAVALILLVKSFEKKYPFKPVVKNLKIAVFGLDYETKNDTDIFVEIKSNDKPDHKNPFDGY